MLISYGWALTADFPDQVRRHIRLIGHSSSTLIFELIWEQVLDLNSICLCALGFAYANGTSALDRPER